MEARPCLCRLVLSIINQVDLWFYDSISPFYDLVSSFVILVVTLSLSSVLFDLSCSTCLSLIYMCYDPCDPRIYKISALTELTNERRKF